ncbi:MAG: autotransporter domain-containing protein [Alphaproteobacteria bacterium]|nr:autotransporter domain-containing protein [Alphaproteobacteria bacterium]
MTKFKKTLLVGTALVAVGGFASGAMAAECAVDPTGGTSCELTADFGAALVISDGDTVTVSDDVTISNIINGADADPTGILTTSGTGITVTQTAVIGGVNEVGDFNIAATDTWIAQNTLDSEAAINVLGTLTVDAAGNMVISTTAGGIEIGATGVVNVLDSTTGTVGLATANGIDIADGGVLTITDAAGLTLGEVDGNAAGEGVINFNDDFATTNDIGANAKLAEVNVAASKTLMAGAGITADAIKVAAGGTLAAVDQTVTGDITLAAGAGVSVTTGTIDGGITGSTGAESITVAGAGTVGGGGNAIDLGAGNDTVTFTGAGTIDADTLAGGTGTDTIVVNGAAARIDSDVTGFETATIETAHALTLNGDAAIASVEFEADGTVALATTKTLTGAVDNVTGADGAGTLTIVSGATGSAVTGAVGATNSLKQVTVTGANAASFGSTVNADDMDIDAAATVTFNGDVTTANGLNLDNQDAVVILADNADWTGNIISTGGPSGTITFQGTSTFDGQIGLAAGTGADAINVNGADETVTITGDSFTVALTTVADAGLVLGGNMTASGNLTNNGSITVGEATTLTANALADSTGTITIVVGTTALGADNSGTLTLTVAEAWANLDGTNAATTGNTLQLAVGGGRIEDGETFSIMGAGSLTVDQAAAAINDTSALFDFTVTGGNGAALVATADMLTSSSVVDSGAEAAAVDAILGITDAQYAADTNLAAVYDAVAGASTATIDAVVESIMPDISGGNVVAATVVNNNTMGLTETRLASLRDGGMTGMAAGNMGEGLGMWGQVFGQTGEQDKRDGISGFDVDTVGFAVGVDTQNLMADTTVGLAFAYADTEVDSKNVNTEIDTYQFTLYGEYELDDTTWLTGQAAYATGDNDVRRSNVGGVAGLTSDGDFDSDTWSLRAELGRDYAMDSGMVLTPSVLANYMYYDGDDYTETGAGGASLVVDQDEVSIFELGLGLDASWMFQQADGSYVEPEVRVGYRYDVIGDEVETTNRFVGGGATFTTEGADPAQSTFNIGGAVTYYAVNNWEFTANYDFEVKEDYDAHAGYLRAAYKF